MKNLKQGVNRDLFQKKISEHKILEKELGIGED